MTKPRIDMMRFTRVDPEYGAKAEQKGRSKTEVAESIRWRTGYRQEAFEIQLEKQADAEICIAEAPQMDPARALIKSKVCGVQVAEIEAPTLREMRSPDTFIDEFARRNAMAKILRKA